VFVPFVFGVWSVVILSVCVCTVCVWCLVCCDFISLCLYWSVVILSVCVCTVCVWTVVILLVLVCFFTCNFVFSYSAFMLQLC